MSFCNHARQFVNAIHKNGKWCERYLVNHGKMYSNSVLLDSKNLPEMALRNPSRIKVLPEEEMQKFKSFFPKLVEDLTGTNLVTDMDEVNKRFKEVLHYNVPTGKQIRAAMLIAAYKFIVGKSKLPEDEFERVAFIAWCIEMISSYILIMDDIMDNSETRRGKKSWFYHENVKLKAINDGTLIQMSVFKLLDAYLADHKYHHEISRVFVEVILKTFVGQVMDCEPWDPNKSTMERFNNTAYNKTGYYTFYFPVVTAMFMSERTDLQLHTEGLKVFLELGRFYQLQNDFMDVYGEMYSGKMGTDIQEGKYSWLIVKALQAASPDQKKILCECYGKWDSECVEQVIQIYNDLKLNETYNDEVKAIYIRVLKYIKNINSEVGRDLMFGVTRVCLGYDFLLK